MNGLIWDPADDSDLIFTLSKLLVALLFCSMLFIKVTIQTLIKPIEQLLIFTMLQLLVILFKLLVVLNALKCQ